MTSHEKEKHGQEIGQEKECLARETSRRRTWHAPCVTKWPLLDVTREGPNTGGDRLTQGS